MNGSGEGENGNGYNRLGDAISGRLQFTKPPAGQARDGTTGRIQAASDFPKMASSYGSYTGVKPPEPSWPALIERTRRLPADGYLPDRPGMRWIYVSREMARQASEDAELAAPNRAARPENIDVIVSEYDNGTFPPDTVIKADSTGRIADGNGHRLPGLAKSSAPGWTFIFLTGCTEAELLNTDVGTPRTYTQGLTILRKRDSLGLYGITQGENADALAAARAFYRFLYYPGERMVKGNAGSVTTKKVSRRVWLEQLADIQREYGELPVSHARRLNGDSQRSTSGLPKGKILIPVGWLTMLIAITRKTQPGLADAFWAACESDTSDGIAQVARVKMQMLNAMRDLQPAKPVWRAAWLVLAWNDYVSGNEPPEEYRWRATRPDGSPWAKTAESKAVYEPFPTPL